MSEQLAYFYAKIRGDLIYAAVLLACLLGSLASRHFSDRMKAVFGSRRALDGAIGFALALAATRSMILCSLSVVAAHLLLYKYVKDPTTLTNASFFGTFAYLAALRMQHWVGLPPLAHIANAIQLIMTLRVIGLSYEIADGRAAAGVAELAAANLADPAAAEAVHKMERQLPRRTIAEPTTVDTFNYLYSFVGLFTGPYYSFQTFTDSERFGRPTTVCLRRLVSEKTSKLWWSVPLLLAFSWLDPVDALRGDKIDDYSILALVLWSALAFIHFRMRIYTAWMLSETICILAGIGVYPAAMAPRPGAGPTAHSWMVWSRQDADRAADLTAAGQRPADDALGAANESVDIAGEATANIVEEPRKRSDKGVAVGPGGDAAMASSAFPCRSNGRDDDDDCRCSSETISNLDIARIEHSDGFRSGMRAWNRSVQFWLANFVYKRSHNAIRMPYTMFVSAFWHGIHPGYFLSFLTIPLCTTAEDLLFRVFPADRRPMAVSVIWSLIRMRGFESMACGFLLLTWTDTVRLWTNLYLWLHVTSVAVIVGSKAYLIFCRPAAGRPSRSETDERTEVKSDDEFSVRHAKTE